MAVVSKPRFSGTHFRGTFFHLNMWLFLFAGADLAMRRSLRGESRMKALQLCFFGAPLARDLAYKVEFFAGALTTVVNTFNAAR